MRPSNCCVRLNDCSFVNLYWLTRLDTQAMNSKKAINCVGCAGTFKQVLANIQRLYAHMTFGSQISPTA